MAIEPDKVRAYEQQLLRKLEVVEFGLDALRTLAPERAMEILAQITKRLQLAAGLDEATSEVPAAPAALNTAAIPGPGGADMRARTESRRPVPVIIAARTGGADEVEEFILEILAENPAGLSVQDLVGNLEDAELDIKRKTLVVRLHRLVHAGRLTSLAHGHYALSEAERARMRA
jgi:hypothetical protein